MCCVGGEKDFGGEAAGGRERRKEAVVQVSHTEKRLWVCWIYLDFCTLAVNVCHLFGIILFSKTRHLSNSSQRLTELFCGVQAVRFRHQGNTGLPSPFQWNKALTFILIIGSWRNGETCGCKNKELRRATEKLTGHTDYYSSCLELKQMTFKCGVGDTCFHPQDCSASQYERQFYFSWSSTKEYNVSYAYPTFK